MQCRKCGAQTSLGSGGASARFCGQCGTPFAPEPQAAAKDPHGGERRQLTVMFADVVGSTALSGRIDPETLRAVLAEYHSVCSECISRYGGTVLKYLGDGILALFGYPQAHENDAERAVLAGLAMTAAVRDLRTRLEARHGFGLDTRIGLHTGLVVIGEMAVGDARVIDAIGETPNIAARVQGEAAPNTVCVSSATRALLKQHVVLASLGRRSMKGVATDHELFEVRSVSAPQPSHRPAAAAPLLGRSPEHRELTARWRLAREGSGHAVLISGEGGIGKSRLLQAFREGSGVAPEAWWTAFCSPFYQNSPLRPLIELVERMGDTAMVGLVGTLLDPRETEDPALRNLTPDQRKRRTFDALIAWLRTAASRQPLILVVEDLHWIDASTREFVGVLLERITELPVLVVLTFRPEFIPTWALHGQVATLALTRLAREECIALIAGIAGADALPQRLVDEILQRTDGIPLFVEEMAKAIVASGATSHLEVPATLRDSLTARLDRLGGAKLVAQVGSVLGRDFHYEALHAVCDLPAVDLEAHLGALNRAEILHQSGAPPASHYVFKHALIQEAAYDTLLKSARQHYHRRAAHACVERFPDVVQSRPELIAYHFSRAAMPEAAVDYWQRAGELAVTRSGYPEALGHMGAALEQLDLLPDDAARKPIELRLRVKIGPALVALKGMNGKETGENYARACELAEELGDSSERFMAMWGDWLYKTQSGQLRAATERSAQLVGLSGKLGDEAFVLQAHHSRWTNLLNTGEIATARIHTLTGMRLYDPKLHRDHKHLFGGHDPGTCAYGVGSYAACLCGGMGEAEGLSARAIAIARDVDHPFSLMVSFTMAASAAHSAREYARARPLAEELVGMGETHGFKQWVSAGLVFAGAARHAAGDSALGLKLVDEGVAMQLERGVPAFHQLTLCSAAEAHLRSGNYGRAHDLLTEAMARCEKMGVGWYRSENLRLQAETLRQAKRIEAGESVTRLEEACAVARDQGAALLEWRATISLARVLARHGREAEARARLGIVARATAAGVDCADVREGMQLLTELA